MRGRRQIIAEGRGLLRSVLQTICKPTGRDRTGRVKRLLELKPRDRRARRLLKELKAYGKGGNMRLGRRRDERFDAVGSTTSPLKELEGI